MLWICTILIMPASCQSMICNIYLRVSSPEENSVCIPLTHRPTEPWTGNEVLLNSIRYPTVSLWKNNMLCFQSIYSLDKRPTRTSTRHISINIYWLRLRYPCPGPPLIIQGLQSIIPVLLSANPLSIYTLF